MLNHVEAGLGGIVAQSAVVDARLRVVRAVLLLQVLWNRGDEMLDIHTLRALKPIKPIKPALISSKHLLIHAFVYFKSLKFVALQQQL